MAQPWKTRPPIRGPLTGKDPRQARQNYPCIRTCKPNGRLIAPNTSVKKSCVNWRRVRASARRVSSALVAPENGHPVHLVRRRAGRVAFGRELPDVQRLARARIQPVRTPPCPTLRRSSPLPRPRGAEYAASSALSLVHRHGNRQLRVFVRPVARPAPRARASVRATAAVVHEAPGCGSVARPPRSRGLRARWAISLHPPWPSGTSWCSAQGQIPWCP